MPMVCGRITATGEIGYWAGHTPSDESVPGRDARNVRKITFRLQPEAEAGHRLRQFPGTKAPFERSLRDVHLPPVGVRSQILEDPLPGVVGRTSLGVVTKESDPATHLMAAAPEVSLVSSS